MAKKPSPQNSKEVLNVKESASKRKKEAATPAPRLDASIPANNQKIIELFNKIKKHELDVSPEFQRKLVWKKQHKIKFIDTILHNFPFPEIYLAPDPAGVDLETLTLKDLIVDGQQRLTTIVNYIEGKDVFASEGRFPIKKFADLDRNTKTQFLNYEVSVRYLKNANQNQINEVFQRINSTEYALNNTERLNAQWGESEFICFAKQLVEKEIDADLKSASYKISSKNRTTFVKFFNEKYKIFTENDLSRMLALQYVMALLATICEDSYFTRNDKVQYYVEKYIEEFLDAGIIEYNLLETIEFIDSLKFEKESYWFNKINLFNLICELYRFEKSSIDIQAFKARLFEIEKAYRDYYIIEQFKSDNNSSLFHAENKEQLRIKLKQSIPDGWLKYFELFRESVNSKSARDFRGTFIRDIITESIAPIV